MTTGLFTGTAPPALGPYRLRDYDQLPDEPRCELVFGRLHVTASPFSRHQIVSYVLGQLLGRVAEASGGIVLQPPPDVVLADHSVVQPDLVYVSALRLAIVGNRVEGAPDLVVEILSPSTAGYDRSEKQDLYALSGVKEYWLVDHERRQIEFLTNEAGRFVPAPSVKGRYRSTKVPDLHLDVSELWRLVDATLRRLPRGR
jgi:Uma2 family endonuclease